MAYLCTPEALRLQVRQLRRWLFAAAQDRDPRVRFLHASYGVATLDAIRQVASDLETADATGADMLDLHRQLVAWQDDAQRELETQSTMEESHE